MDPDAAWKELSELFCGSEQSNWERITELADCLLHWLKRDGFPPTITGIGACEWEMGAPIRCLRVTDNAIKALRRLSEENIGDSLLAFSGTQSPAAK
jgi:hypothetical protein